MHTASQQPTRASRRPAVDPQRSGSHGPCSLRRSIWPCSHRPTRAAAHASQSRESALSGWLSQRHASIRVAARYIAHRELIATPAKLYVHTETCIPREETLEREENDGETVEHRPRGRHTLSVCACGVRWSFFDDGLGECVCVCPVCVVCGSSHSQKPAASRASRWCAFVKAFIATDTKDTGAPAPGHPRLKHGTETET